MNRENEIILEMILLQQKLNDETNGKDWEFGYTTQGKLISWKRCIYMECAELIDSFAWKHWKSLNATTNENNLLVEIVDIWHFILSLMLSHYKIHGLGDVNTLAKNIIDSAGFSQFCKEPQNIKNENIYEIMNDIERLIHVSSGFNCDIYELLRIYFSVALKCGVNLKSLFECYVAKNVLNRFRQDNGYKEGNYKKIWNGKEDNEVMSEILASGIHNIDEIYSSLNKAYKSIKA